MADSNTSEQRYARHFALAGVGREGQEKFKNARVLMIGAGGLGSPIALYLAAAGVGHITIIDPDVVSLSNLQRQILFSTKDVELLKATRARDRMLELNSEIEVQALSIAFDASNARELVRAHDLVIDGSDNFKTRYCANDACVLENKPLVSGALYKFEAQISLLHADGGPCYRCLYPNPPPAEAIPNCQEAGVLGVLPGLAGTLMATEALKWILRLGESLSGKLLLIDALSTSFFTRRFSRNPSCAVCGEHPTILSLETSAPVAAAGLSRAELERASAETRLIDVRTSQEFAAVSLPKFSNVPLASLASSLESWERDVPVVVICQSGKRSARALEILREAGFKNVSHVEGGLSHVDFGHSLS